MKIDANDKHIIITLSRRNLLALLTKLEHPDSHKGIFMEHAHGDATLWVFAEDDDTHYADRPYGPGPMHPTTERDITSHNET